MLAELLPVELQVVGRVEERARRVGVDELGPVPGVEVPPVLGEGDPHRRPMLRARCRRAGPLTTPPPPPPPPPPEKPPPEKPLDPEAAGVDAIVPPVVTANPSIACPKSA